MANEDRDQQYAQMQASLNQAKAKAAKDGRLDHDKDGEQADLERLQRAAQARIDVLYPAPADQGLQPDVRE